MFKMTSRSLVWAKELHHHRLGFRNCSALSAVDSAAATLSVVIHLGSVVAEFRCAKSWHGGV